MTELPARAQGAIIGGGIVDCSIAFGSHEIESTVRYIGIEVDDALAIAEQVDVLKWRDGADELSPLFKGQLRVKSGHGALVDDRLLPAGS